MPEGHSIHRLALAFDELLHGERLAVSSPQGRFAVGAELLDGHRLMATDAHGKHLFLGFSANGATDPEELRWLRVHLGLYGSWTFSGDASFQAPHAIGAPRRRVAEEETALSNGDPAPAADGTWEPPEPRGAVRVRLLGEHGVADLTGPTACEVVSPGEKAAVHARLGPDPLRADGDAEQFVANVRRRARPVGELLMDQSVIAGVGNIYRAEALYRSRLHPRRLGRSISPAKLRAMWEDLTALMSDGVATGRIVTTDPEDRQEEDDRWYVYHRSGRPCLRCGSKVAEDVMDSRRVFWCPREQRRPSSLA